MRPQTFAPGLSDSMSLQVACGERDARPGFSTPLPGLSSETPGPQAPELFSAWRFCASPDQSQIVLSWNASAAPLYLSSVHLAIARLA